MVDVMRHSSDPLVCSSGNSSLEDLQLDTGCLIAHEESTSTVGHLVEGDETESSHRSQIAQLQEEISQREAKMSELTEGRAKVEEELQQREESEAALHNQITQLQEEISQMESSLTAADESRSLAESALAQLQQQHNRLNKRQGSCEKYPFILVGYNSIQLMFLSSASLDLKDLMNELYEVTEWFQLGLQLNVPPHVLTQIKKDHVHDGALGKVYMLKEWLNSVASEAPWADIVAALVRIRMQGLAQRLAEKYGE